jgi:hypothetical protein
MAFIVRRPSFGNKRVAPLQERNPEAEASVKGATRPCSNREHRPAKGEGSSAYRQENQAFPWKWLIQRIVEPLPVERARARSRQRLTLDARGRSLGRIPVPGRPCWGRGWWELPGVVVGLIPLYLLYRSNFAGAWIEREGIGGSNCVSDEVVGRHAG